MKDNLVKYRLLEKDYVSLFPLNEIKKIELHGMAIHKFAFFNAFS